MLVDLSTDFAGFSFGIKIKKEKRAMPKGIVCARTELVLPVL